MEKLGSLFYFGERILLGCQGIETEPHAHYAVSILISMDKTFTIETENGVKTSTRGIILGPNFYHSLFANDSKMIVIQLDPKSEEYKTLPHKDFYQIPDFIIEKISLISGGLLDGSLDCSSAKNLYNSILEILGSKIKSDQILDERVIQAIKIIKQSLPNNIPIGDITSQIGLSKDRFMHLFKDNIGIPLRQYILWQRLHKAAKLLQDGVNLTEASHAAGFSDQAHLSRTFKKMFGVKPSLFLGGQKLIKVSFCEF
ncbi:AraC family transcriptional regulator [Leptospira sp. 96542]|nr:AraC family transcriptional regulator [Leptospira sp. 96542]